MKRIKVISVLMVLVMCVMSVTACAQDPNVTDRYVTEQNSRTMVENQPTPTDITYSLSRYNLIRRAYYMAGEFEKAANLECAVDKPQAYIYLFVEGVGCVMVDSVDGIVTSQRSYLTPDSEQYAASYADWLADVDGTYGENPDGIFYFDLNGEYHEWTGLYYYSEKYYEINDPVITIVSGEFEAAG